MSQAQLLIETLTLQGIDLWVENGQVRYRAPKAVLTAEGLAQLRQQKDELLQALATTMYQATWEQQSAWAAYQAVTQKITQHVVFAARLHGALEMTAFQRAWQTMVQRHASLRTTFLPSTALEKLTHTTGKGDNRETQNQRLQVIVQGVQPITVTYVNAERWHEDEVQAQLGAQAALPFALSQGPLLRIALFARTAVEHLLLVIAPRLTLDEASLRQLLNEFGHCYVAAQTGDRCVLPPIDVTPATYAAWQATQLPVALSALDNSAKATPVELALNLPVDYQRRADAGQASAQHSFTLDATLVAQVREWADAHAMELDTLLLTAFQCLLYRYTGQHEFALGLSLTPRRYPAFRHLISGSVDVEFYTAVGGQDSATALPSFSQLATQVQQRLQTTALLNLTSPATGQQITFALHYLPPCVYSQIPATWGDLTIEPVTVTPLSDRTELKLDLVDNNGAITGVFAYHQALFAPATITCMVGHFQTLLAGLVNNPDQRIDQLPLLTATEQQKILVEWNHTDTDYPQDRCLHQWFEAQVERTPDAVALLFDKSTIRNGTAQPAHLTYRELNQRANQLAHYLQSLGVGKALGAETLVGICVERSPLMIVGLLGILKAGGAYVPLDPLYPQERIAFMLQDAEVAVLLTQADLCERLVTTPTTTIVPLDSHWAQIATCDSSNPPSAVKAGNLAYVLYTSGSTGQPKGVMIEHCSATALLAWGQRVYSPTELAGMLVSTSICFDLSVYEIFLPLSVGGKLILVENGLHLPTNAHKHEVTLINTVPSVIEELVRQQAIPATVQTINLAGEPLRQALVEKLYAIPTVDKVYDLYGPSEDTTYSTFKLRAVGEPATIGKPIDNTQIYILDQRTLQPQPVGVPGELHIGGMGLARGYLKRPELTTTKFIANPFGPPTNPGRLYKTGDLARWLLDGNIEFLGRIDNQVKLRGFRIELGEIEATLTTHPAVQEAIVMAQPSHTGHQQLTAYIVPKYTQPTAVELWPSLPEQAVYDDLIYHTLTSDEGRNQHYKAAIAQVVKHKTVVEIGTGPDALLALICCQAGAKKVYAIEIDEEAARKAADRIQALGLTAQIEIIYGDSTQIELPELVDICVSGIVGPIGGAQGAVTLINDAHRFLKPDGVMIPIRCITRVAAVMLPDEIYRRPQFTAVSDNYVRKIFARAGYPFDLRLCIRHFPKANLLSTIATFETLDFAHPIAPSEVYEMSLTVEKPGRLDGFLVWMQMHLCEGEVMDILAGEYAPMPVYFPIFDGGTAVTAGDHIKATSSRTLSDNGLNPDYTMHGSLTKQNGQVIEFEHTSYHHKAQFRQTPFYARLFAPDQWRAGVNGLAELHTTPASLTAKLRQHLSLKLPDYMVPAAFVVLDALPLTPNGKVDRRALPAPEVVTEATKVIVQPRNPVEATIAQLWGELLDQPQVSIHDKFMELGGHSLQAMQIVTRINQAFPGNLSITDFFKYPTICELADYLAQNSEEFIL